MRLRGAAMVLLAVMLALLPAPACKRAGEPTPRGNDEGADAHWTFGGQLPGAPSIDSELSAKLDAKWSSRPSDYEPRTRHRRPDGSPQYTNRLFLQSSPYLLQHAHNPVNWYPWGDEAFQAAKRLGRPVLLSVGYSTCHWCHVMEEESFEDDEIARYLNENYVAIKVDREERPDVDAVYMAAVQSLTGGGGWPMTTWLTTDRKPFYGGTYFPARDGDRGAQVGFLTLLRKLKADYDGSRDKIAESAGQIAEQVRLSLSPKSGGGDLPPESLLTTAAAQITATLDPIWGGVRGVNKFPSGLPVRFLFRHYRRSGSTESLRAATLTLEKMASGGMCDQIGGGFHRYSTDARWLVPHFEKMLYDNALLAMDYLEGYQVTRREDFARVVHDVLRYVERDMTSPGGAFYSATDADSPAPDGHRKEGWFFTWTPAEIRTVLGPDQAQVVLPYYGVTDGGNFEGRNVLNVRAPLPEVSASLKLPADRAQAVVDEAREVLYAERKRRPAPLRDEKILAAWNGLMISAYARSALVFRSPKYAAMATRAAEFAMSTLWKDGRLFRTFKDGHASSTAYLDDHAFLIAALLDLFEATGEPRWLTQAALLDDALAKHFEDMQLGGFFLTSDGPSDLLVRDKPAYDGAEPSGNSVQLLNLLRLEELMSPGDRTYAHRAERAFRAFASTLNTHPASLSEMLIALDFRHDSPKEIVIVTPTARAEAEPFLAQLRRTYLPNRVLVVVVAGTKEESRALPVPSAQGKTAQRGKATAYVCEHQTCELPTTDPEVFARQIQKNSRSPLMLAH